MANTGPRGQFIPTSFIWFAQQLATARLEPHVRDIILELARNTNQVALSLNQKNTGYYDTQPYITGQSFFPLTAASSSSVTQRAVQRQVVVIDSGLPNTTSDTYAHGIQMNNSIKFVDIYGVAMDLSTQSYLKLPYASPTLANNIALEVSGDNVVITTGSDRSAYTLTYVILEFLTE